MDYTREVSINRNVYRICPVCSFRYPYISYIKSGWLTPHTHYYIDIIRKNVEMLEMRREKR